MDESWRMRMGFDPFFSAARKSIDQTFSSAAMDADDFADVFGGPPRSVLTRKFSGDFSRSSSFYDEIFLPSELYSRKAPASKSHGRSLPAFRIPAGGDGFYGDVFGFSGGAQRTTRERSQTKWVSNSSSVITSEDVSPLRPPATAVSGDDVALSSFTSRLRPLNVPSRSSGTGQNPEAKKHGIPAYGQAGDSFSVHKNTPGNGDFYYGSSRRASPETISLDPNSFRSVKLSMDDYGPSSPASSPVSSVCDEIKPKQRTRGFTMEEEEEEEEEDDDEAMSSSYVIEINSDHYREGGGSDSIDIDEAIAWAKERFLRPDTKPQIIETECQSHEGSSGTSTLKSTTTEEEESNSRIGEEEEKSDEQMEMEKDREITHWLNGKETDIKLLLSTLHHVLWPESGWYPIPLMNLQEGSQVKKAYQKARLCLHPDKLQQRGASPPQKYIAKRVFAILQDAWAAYVSREGFSS
ncbi:PREDICTED: uncharacterized protein LOC104820660 [Tarenaya hassleriana]|uniref:uncharacterized protein LOC104820660 n=1 Tax=Tarenaya hassleriana TaxID=28532 RepID=UPI00053C17B4|nr:PREDICTED: uncharacterized protein LOC104820660 [Tarenaya hassleriana]